MKEIVFTIEDATEGGFVARAVGESIFTQAESVAGIKQNIKEAVELHFNGRDEQPKVARLRFIKEEIMEL